MNLIWTPVHIGKFKGKTLPQILFDDPNWFFWCVETKQFHGRGAIESEVKLILPRTQNIQIPGNPQENRAVDYFIDPVLRTFSHFELVPAHQPKPEGPSFLGRLDVINMYLPRNRNEYDKLGYRNFIRCLKQCFFGKSSVRITRQRAERFFNDPRNFT